jgi:hypothetical protein
LQEDQNFTLATPHSRSRKAARQPPDRAREKSATLSTRAGSIFVCNRGSAGVGSIPIRAEDSGLLLSPIALPPSDAGLRNVDAVGDAGGAQSHGALYAAT